MNCEKHLKGNVTCWVICSDSSNSMRSGNPNSGIYLADTSRTLDVSGGNPTCNQGGLMIVERCDRDCYGKKAGKGALIQWEKSMTLGVSQDQTLFVWKETDIAPPTKAMDTEWGGQCTR